MKLRRRDNYLMSPKDVSFLHIGQSSMCGTQDMAGQEGWIEHVRRVRSGHECQECEVLANALFFILEAPGLQVTVPREP